LITKANLISFHGPMLNSDFARKDRPDFTLQSFFRTLGMERGTPGRSGSDCPNRSELKFLSVSGNAAARSAALQSCNISFGYRRKTMQVLRRGLAQGQLIGGNLTLLCNTIGTPWQPPFKNRILFLEDLREEPYRFDRMLTYLLNCGLLQQVAGIAIGINRDCKDPKAKTAKEYRQTLEDVFRERLLPLKVPVVMSLPFGHVPHNATLPIGATVGLDANRGELVLIEPPVR
jgi:muramoyltetrapeptide carboxypeptidase